jgi:hypothetical protein
MSALPPMAAWAERLQLIAQAGLTYSQNPYDLQRFSQIQALAAEMLAANSETSQEKIKALLADERGYQTPKVDVRAVITRPGQPGFWRCLTTACTAIHPIFSIFISSSSNVRSPAVRPQPAWRPAG